MKVFEFINELQAELARGGGGLNDPIVIINQPMGETYSIKKVELEVDEDANGARTLWLHAEEN